MRRTLTGTAAVVALVLVAASAAQARPPKGQAGDGKGAGGRGARIVKLIEEMDLTGKEESRVMEILDAHRQAARNWRSENGQKVRSLHEEIREAHQEGDREAAREAREELQELMGGMREIMDNTRDQLAEVLDEDQMAVLGRAFGVRRRAAIRARHGLAGLDLTDEQTDEIREIMSDARERAEGADDWNKRREIMREAFEKVRDDVLTEEQREKAAAMRKRAQAFGMFRGLDLTDEQKDQIREIMSDARERAEDAEPAERREIMREAFEEVRDEVLTDQQRKKVAARHVRGDVIRIFRGLDLSDEQQEEARGIVSDARERAREAEDRKEKRDIMRDARKRIVEDVLTDEQAEEFRRRMRRHWGQHRRRRGPDQDDAEE